MFHSFLRKKYPCGFCLSQDFEDSAVTTQIFHAEVHFVCPVCVSRNAGKTGSRKLDLHQCTFIVQGPLCCLLCLLNGLFICSREKLKIKSAQHELAADAGYRQRLLVRCCTLCLTSSSDSFKTRICPARTNKRRPLYHEHRCYRSRQPKSFVSLLDKQNPSKKPTF